MATDAERTPEQLTDAVSDDLTVRRRGTRHDGAVTGRMEGNWFPADENELLAWAERAAARLRERFEAWLVPMVDPDLPAARLAHVYVALRGISDALADPMKIVATQIQRLNNDVVPAAFERDDFKSITTNNGYRVTVSTNLRASIRKDQQAAAYEWLRANNLGDLIVETVNAGTLSAAGRHLLEEGGELPEDMFHAFFQNSTSVTPVRK